MSDIYVQYEYKDAVSGSVQHIFAKVPSAKIHEYRQANDDQTKSEEDIAKILSDGPAAKQLRTHRIANWQVCATRTAQTG